MVFILVILRQDIRTYPRLSRAFWLPFLWLTVAASRPISTWFDPNRALRASTIQDYVQGNPTERIILVVFIALGFITIYRRKDKIVLPFRANVWLALLYGFALISVSWSDYQGVSLRRWIRAAGDLLMVLIILTEEDQDKALEHLLRRITIVLVPLSVVLIRWFANYGILYNIHGSPHWVGVTTGKNELGLLCAYLGVFLVWRFINMWPRPDLWDISLFFMLLYLLYGAKSSTSDVVLVVGALLLVGLRSIKRNPRRITYLIIISMFAILVSQWVALNIFGESLTPIFFSATGRDPTFTGRAQLWQELVSMGIRNPVLGAGFSNFWLSHMSQLWARFDWGPINGHNGYLDTFLDLGLIGVFLLLALIAKAYKKLLASIETRGSIGLLLIAFLIMFLAHNFTETHIMKPSNFLWFLFLILAMTAQKKPDSSESQIPQFASRTP